MFSKPEDNVMEFGFIPGQKVADLGSGSGHYATVLSETLGPNGRVYAVDIHKDSLVRLKNTLEQQGRRNIDVVYGDVEEPNGTHLKSEILDGVLISNLIFLVEDKLAAATEAARILKKGGKIVMLEWTDKYSPEKARELFIKAGLRFERQFAVGDHHYGLIFSK